MKVLAMKHISKTIEVLMRDEDRDEVTLYFKRHVITARRVKRGVTVVWRSLQHKEKHLVGSYECA